MAWYLLALFSFRNPKLSQWTGYLFSILSIDFNLFIASCVGDNQIVFKLILYSNCDFTLSINLACVVLGDEGKVCSACYFRNSLLDYIVNGHTSRRAWFYFIPFLSDVLRVAKPEECKLCVADRCH